MKKIIVVGGSPCFASNMAACDAVWERLCQGEAQLLGDSSVTVSGWQEGVSPAELLGEAEGIVVVADCATADQLVKTVTQLFPKGLSQTALLDKPVAVLCQGEDDVALLNFALARNFERAFGQKPAMLKVFDTDAELCSWLRAVIQDGVSVATSPLVV